MNWIKWLYPGTGVKRWIFMLVMGVVVLVLGVASLRPRGVMMLLDAINQLTGSIPKTAMLGLGLLLVFIGLGLVFWAAISVVRALMRPYAQDNNHLSKSNLVDALRERHTLQKGPKIVAIGGGTGLSILLQGLRDISSNITAIVTVADDGGSSGRLRTLDLPAPGDIRNCILALADASEPMKTLFNYRYSSPTTNPKELAGHSFGNLLIATLTQITGDFNAAVKMACRILAVRGQVLPATTQSDVELCAVLNDGRIICGETEVGSADTPISRVFLRPEECQATEDVLRAIKEADLIVMGPGSLYTSIVATLLVGGITQAIKEAPAPKMYICNLMTQAAETLDYKVSDHVTAILEHTHPSFIDVVLVNTADIEQSIKEKYQKEGAQPVRYDAQSVEKLGVKVIADEFVEQKGLVRHATEKIVWHLADVLWNDKGKIWRK